VGFFLLNILQKNNLFKIKNPVYTGFLLRR
jgi:hypothetical protein